MILVHPRDYEAALREVGDPCPRCRTNRHARAGRGGGIVCGACGDWIEAPADEPATVFGPQLCACGSMTCERCLWVDGFDRREREGEWREAMINNTRPDFVILLPGSDAEDIVAARALFPGVPISTWDGASIASPPSDVISFVVGEDMRAGWVFGITVDTGPAYAMRADRSDLVRVGAAAEDFSAGDIVYRDDKRGLWLRWRPPASVRTLPP